MKGPVQNMSHSRHSQGGAVAIVVGLSIFVLVGMLGLVLDLGHLYVAKTGLQNAADAAALSGAKELNGSLSGVNNAQARAIEAAGKNEYFRADISDVHGTPVTITNANLWVSNCPDDACTWLPVSSITTNAQAADKTFLKVHTGQRDLRTWFIQVMPGAPTSTATFGMAVAGKYVVDITPIAICQLPNDPDMTNELGYKRGVSYKIKDANPIGPGTMYWLDPESATPGICPATNTTETLPYVCAGKVAYTPIVGQTVNTNTGISDPQLAALDSRFDDYPPQSKCDPATAPPDTNVKEYNACLTTNSVDGTCNNSDTTVGSPSKWMKDDYPARQSIKFDIYAGIYQPLPYASSTVGTFKDYGVLWSAYRPTGKVVADWPALYKGTVDAALGYPETSPYAQTSGNFFKAPSPAHLGKAGRRVLNLVIVDCSTAGGVCRPATVMGVGKFFMQKKANQPSNKEIYVEFGGLLSTPFPPSDIKLYR